MKTVFEKSVALRRGVTFGKEEKNPVAGKYLRKEAPALPELSELDVVRHYTNLSRRNFSVDTHFYPLGSCTMKYNPKINEKISGLAGFAGLHPMTAYISPEDAQGALEVLHKISALLAEITGMKKITTQPYAGAHGELTGVLLAAAYHSRKGNKKTHIIVSESAHGTNPASAAMGGYDVVSVPVNEGGETDFEAFKSAINSETAAVMMTVPSTLGVFETRIKEISAVAAAHDALMYYDGANLNAIMGKVRPGDVGFDIVHMNLHKTFSTPHGGGGPGSGIAGVSEKLVDFLPTPVIAEKDGRYSLDFNIKHTIGRVASFFGNFGVILKAYAYILMLGKEGLIDVSEKAVLNANYIMAKLRGIYHLPYDRICGHECVFTAKNQMKHGVRAIDIAKALIDRGFHPPTVYFPLVVEEAIMIEPTETESKAEIDSFIDAMKEIAALCETEPEKIKNAPLTTPVARPDEAKAAREMRLTCEM